MDEFEQVYRQHFAAVFSFARRLTGDDLQAEELTEDAFFRALKAIKNFHGKPEELRPWLCAIARNAYVSGWRGRKREQPLETLPEPEDNRPGPQEHTERRDEAMRLHEALHRLPEPYKEVFSLRVFGELPYADIASIFGKTETWARVTCHRAKEKISKQLEESA